MDRVGKISLCRIGPLPLLWVASLLGYSTPSSAPTHPACPFPQMSIYGRMKTIIDLQCLGVVSVYFRLLLIHLDYEANLKIA